MVADSGGVWVGTGKGIWFFNGRDWRPYIEKNASPGNRLEDVVVRKDGTVWVTSVGAGIASFNGRTWNQYPYPGPVAIAINGVVWAGAGKSLAGFDGRKWRVYEGPAPMNYDITGVATAPDNSVWAIFWAAGVGHFDGETWTMYTPADNLPGDCEYVRDIAVDADGVVWVGFEKATQRCRGGLARFDGREWVLLNGEKGWTSETICSIAVASDGGLWVSTLGGGISRFDGNAWQAFDVISVFLPNYAGDISSVLAAGADGEVWVGVYGQALRYDGQQWTALDMADGPIGDIRGITVGPRNTVWFATINGLSRYELALDPSLSGSGTR
jgi:ligand-binding sensor domain-containing protein